MKSFLILLLVVVVVVGVIAYERNWFTFSASAQDGSVQINASINSEQWRIDRDEYRQKADAQLAEGSKKLDELKARSANANGEARLALNKAVDDMNRKYQAARADLKELENAGKEQWQSARTKLGQALDDLKRWFENAASDRRMP